VAWITFYSPLGEGLVIYFLIVVGLYNKGSGNSAECSGSSWDLTSCHCVVARRVASGKAMWEEACKLKLI
jgi:hypothetical protein